MNVYIWYDHRVIRFMYCTNKHDTTSIYDTVSMYIPKVRLGSVFLSSQFNDGEYNQENRKKKPPQFKKKLTISWLNDNKMIVMDENE